MGAKDSRPSFISYEDAVKRVSDSELRRIREAFKRCAGTNGTSLSLEAFVHEVLCDGVPFEVAEWLYQACGGTKRGIAFKELLCGIVVLTKGNLEEKIKFLWTLYVNNQSDNGTYIYKRDFARSLHLENTSLPITGAQKTAEILLSLFGPGEKVTFEQFRSWLLIHKDATVLSQWLLSGGGHVVPDLETPTFYQSLAGVTHLEERDIIELEKCFWSLRNAAPTGQLDAESLTPLLSPPLPRAAVAGTVAAFDENRDGHVDFKELCCGLSAACRGPRTERLKFCFKIFDMDRDGVLNRKELVDMVEVLCTVANEALKLQGSRASTPDGDPEPSSGFEPDATLADLRDKLVALPRDGRMPMFQLGPNGDGDNIVVSEQVTEDSAGACEMALTLEDFLIWSVESADALVSPFLALLVEVCHIVLGLRPQCAHQERDIVVGWLRREVARGYAVGQFWFLVGAEWWGAWLAYTAGAGDACCRARARHADDAIVCDDSFTSNSTESMGSLLWRAESASLGSASSSGVSSAAAQRPPPHPGPIDNKRLRAHTPLKVRSLTGEGGHLRRDVTLAQHRDFELVPDALWRALALWYGGPEPLPRQVIRPPNSDVELELYPLELKIFRHVPSTQTVGVSGVGMGVGGGVGALGVGGGCPERQLAYTAAFSRLATVKQVTEFLCSALGLAREDVRLWALGANAVLLDDERPTLQQLRLHERPRLLLERRNPDLTWPEEIGALSGSRATERRETLVAPHMPGATGLHNLGNTCFMNAALQAVWNTGPLTQYFNSGMHLYELNTSNPLGTRGALALRFGELCKEVWSCSARSVAPLRVRWVVSRWARALGGGGQHDAQELLAWLLDALHEDLNRRAPRPPAPAPLHPPPPAPHHPPPPADRDQVAAAAAWEAYTARNHSILTELFYGQLKSRVRCDACGRHSVRFDAFNMLSLPLPMECDVRVQTRVILLDGSVPVKYGLRINSEGTYMELKQKLSKLCGLAPESMLVVELSGATIGRVLEDGARVRAGAGAGAGELTVYELPPPLVLPHRPPADGWCEEAQQWAERSRSEVLVSQSPPGTFYTRPLESNPLPAPLPLPLDYRSRTLPKQTRDTDSPTLSVKSLDAKPTSPCLKVKFGSSPSNMCKMDDTKDGFMSGKIQYLVAVHRKQCRQDAYFLGSQRCKPALFGEPLLVGLRPAMSGRDLYAAVWTQVARLLSPRPPTHDQSNHATDCDDSLGYEFPFTLRLVNGNGTWCGACAWPALCRGCALPSDARPLLLCCGGCGGSAAERKASLHAAAGAGEGEGANEGAGEGEGEGAGSPLPAGKLSRHASARLARENLEEGEVTDAELGVVRCLELGGNRRLQLAIDWDPTALHLRYQTTREKTCVEHPSVGECGAAAAAVDLASCLRAFTSDERLEAAYHCERCRAARPAYKKLQLWRAPPVLIIHLKRFQYVNNKWIKSQKVVNFPFEDFDPTEFLAAVPQETILRHHELKRSSAPTAGLKDQIEEEDAISETDTDDEEHSASMEQQEPTKQNSKAGVSPGRRARLQSASLAAAPVRDDELLDYHQHRLLPGEDPFDLKYNLYAVVSHSGQLSGGHYVCYARNPSGAWLCYNDSACRELPRHHIDPSAAYLLFYQRRRLNYCRYQPEVSGPPPAPPAADPDEPDLAKTCAIV